MTHTENDGVASLLTNMPQYPVSNLFPFVFFLSPPSPTSSSSSPSSSSSALLFSFPSFFHSHSLRLSFSDPWRQADDFQHQEKWCWHVRVCWNQHGWRERQWSRRTGGVWWVFLLHANTGNKTYVNPICQICYHITDLYANMLILDAAYSDICASK